jgi:hypothetical protein
LRALGKSGLPGIVVAYGLAALKGDESLRCPYDSLLPDPDRATSFVMSAAHVVSEMSQS